MQFTKMLVPDKRWQSGLRPVVVSGNIFSYVLWNIFKGLEALFKSLKDKVENKFTDIKEEEVDNGSTQSDEGDAGATGKN